MLKFFMWWASFTDFFMWTVQWQTSNDSAQIFHVDCSDFDIEWQASNRSAQSMKGNEGIYTPMYNYADRHSGTIMWKTNENLIIILMMSTEI